MGNLKISTTILILLVSIVNYNNYGMTRKENKHSKNTTFIEKIKGFPFYKGYICCGKTGASLAHSIVNDFYKIETLKMNSTYLLKKYLCWGYMFQPAIMAPFSFLDFNVNILGGIIDTAIFLFLSHSKKTINTKTKVIYIVTSPFNINLNIKISKDFYIAINLVGIIRAVAFLLLIKNKENNKGNILINKINIDNNIDESLNNDIKIEKNKIENNIIDQSINNSNENEKIKSNNIFHDNGKHIEINNNINNNNDIKIEKNEIENNIIDQSINNNNKDEKIKSNNIPHDSVKHIEINNDINNNNNIEINKEDEEKIEKIITFLEEEFYISSFLDDEQLRKIIIENNFDVDEILIEVKKHM